ncbi:MAG: hypothetical protein DMG59_24930 [Acidobacteria bacterium]|nr:MAG: hypothetical protein DMG59_24930 [Acidobacteriota bacterium]
MPPANNRLGSFGCGRITRSYQHCWFEPQISGTGEASLVQVFPASFVRKMPFSEAPEPVAGLEIAA